MDARGTHMLQVDPQILRGPAAHRPRSQHVPGTPAHDLRARTTQEGTHARPHGTRPASTYLPTIACATESGSTALHGLRNIQERQLLHNAHTAQQLHQRISCVSGQMLAAPGPDDAGCQGRQLRRRAGGAQAVTCALDPLQQRCYGFQRLRARG